MVLIWPLRTCSHSEGFCDTSIHDAHSDWVARLSSVVLAGLADGREDFLSEPRLEGFCFLRRPSHQHPVDRALSEEPRGPLHGLRDQGLWNFQSPQLPSFLVANCTGADTCRVVWGLQASRSGHLSRHEQQLMLRVAHEDIQLDAHEIAFFKETQRCPQESQRTNLSASTISPLEAAALPP